MFACIFAPQLLVELSLTEFAYGFSPIVEEVRTGTVVIDVEGCELLFGSPYELAKQVSERAKKSLIEGGALEHTNGRWTGWEVESLKLPPTIRDAVAARLDRLSQDAREIANLAAVIGTSVTLERLHAVSSMGEAELVAALDELSAQRILEERDSAVGARYDFTHPILQQVTYNALGSARVRLLHATVGEALELYYGARADAHAGELALHFARAHTFAPKAVRYLSEAGRGALETYANREAATGLPLLQSLE